MDVYVIAGDIEQWLEEDYLDLLTTAVGCHPFTNPTRDLVELGHAHGVPVYPVIAESTTRVADQRTIEHWCGAAANFWHAGADGVYLFNTFPTAPQHPHFTELGDPKKLARMCKIFVIDKIRIVDGGIAHAIMQSQILPVKLTLRASCARSHCQLLTTLPARPGRGGSSS